jgi:CheY-like chemotaxis protein
MLSNALQRTVVPHQGAAPPPQRHAILIVEDEVLTRMMVADAMRDRGFEVIEAQNPDEAIGLLQSQVPVRLVFTDVQLPGAMDGLALAKLVRQTRPELKVVIASGSAVIEDSPQVADAFFRKPYALTSVSYGSARGGPKASRQVRSISTFCATSSVFTRISARLRTRY